MKQNRLGTSELTVSSLCYGTGSFGTSVRGAELLRLYDTFREAGGNFFDSAHCYAFWVKDGDGASERTLGECVRRRNDRAHVVIATKGGHPARDGYPKPDRYLAAAVIAKDIDDSLERLGLEPIDLYYLHRDDLRVPVGEIVETLNAEIKRGRIRYLGASNWSTERIAAANAYAATHGLNGFVVSQPQWNLAEPNALPDSTCQFLDASKAQWYEKNRFPVVAYSPTAHGYLASGGKLSVETYDNPTSRARVRRVEELASELGVTASQVALAWLMNQPFLVVPILGTLRPDHLADALQAPSVRLTAEQVRWLGGDTPTTGHELPLHG